MSVTPVMERNIRADIILHTDQNHVWMYNYELRKTKKLTLYDDYFIERKSLILTYHLHDMALSASQDIIATDYNNKHVVKISPTGSVSKLCSTAPLYPFGVCINNRQQVVVRLQGGWARTPPHKLVVYSSDGSTVLQEIENDEDGNPLFRTWITQVKQNGIGDYVVADLDRIVCVSSEGRLWWEYSEELCAINGLVCDTYNNVIISDIASSKIHLLSSEGKLVTTLLTEADGIGNPRSLSIDRHGQLWIGQKESIRVIKYLT